MCGRAYHTYTEEELYLRYSNRRPFRLKLQNNFNLSPTQTTPIFLNTENGPDFEMVTWVLIPPWEKEFKTKLSTINAKSETVFESRLYSPFIRTHRCIVPFSGFYEWKKEGTKKQPFVLH